ncbi:TonB-dependent receptor [Caulobacter sp. SL161]|uniref:TonB-dependent receptor domain-containing protein n=1 Tax=Caulobacter sp. SL161 TaxID=2995156 RepID=UPI0022760C0B|nr:TonB-dependent receptor [Caulobacter sp. SL161]MCY1646226.1 TonB-dependent receptor [Caulobacter sp. SL161]
MDMITRRLTSLLLLSTALSMPTWALAQTAPSAEEAGKPTAAAAQSDFQQPEVSIPGMVDAVVITANRSGNVVRTGSQVVSVLSAAEIARTGEGNIAGALTRVTGVTLVGNGYVYVRGLGDRYSLALLNGSPLPSPEPLKRVVPLDLFPSRVIASSLVQKSYSANFPGEFGGGVINLTTRSIPSEGFISIGGSVSGDTETTNQLGYDYYGSKSDWTGFDNGNRDTPSALAAFFASGERISSGKVNTADIASQLVNSRNGVVQKWNHLPANYSMDITAAKPFDLDSMDLGVIGTIGFSNRWSTRDAQIQSSLNADLEDKESDFRRVSTDNRMVLNGLFGASLGFGENKIRWTNLYVHDTIKNTRLAMGRRGGTNVDYMQQNTGWFERQLVNTQLVGEFRPMDKLNVDVRANYANTQRKAPAELSLEYVRTNAAADPFGQYFVNRLNNGNGGDARISYSDLDEDLWSGGVDATYKLVPGFAATVGYAYVHTDRDSSRRDFQFQASNTFPRGVDMLRPDLLLAPAIIKNFNIALVDTNEGNPAFRAQLQNHAAYGKLNGTVFQDLDFDVGARYETARLKVAPTEVFKTPGASLASTRQNESYWLPSATATWRGIQDSQIRLSASKTIARPQFRELIYQFYFDPDSNRMYRGNPLLTDSKLTNLEGRYEWYFASDQRLTVAGFYKTIDRPIESFVSGSDLSTSFANAPKAKLYGAELEVQKYFDLSDFKGDFWASRRLVAIANYTYSKSELQVSASDTVAVFAATSTKATDYFTDGAPLTGQSDHVVNLQFGLEDTERLSQQTLLINYASKRVTSRGLVNSGQPDVEAYPGTRIDFVARQGLELWGREVELKFEARNLTGVGYEEYQKAGKNRVDVNTYDVGRFFSIGASAKF